MSQRVEELLESLNEAERLRALAEQENKENLLLLSGTRSLLAARSTRETYENLFNFLGQIIPYHVAFVLEVQSDERSSKASPTAMRCTISSEDALLDSLWLFDTVLERALAGKPSAVYSVARQPAWSVADRHSALGIVSALYCPFNGPEINAVLVFCHEKKGFYVQKHVQMAERYRHFTEQTLLSMHAKLEALDTARLRKEKERAEKGLIQSEKMASLGLLAAGVAHEINNPLAYISSNMSYLLGAVDDVTQLKQHLLDLLALIQAAPEPNLQAKRQFIEKWLLSSDVGTVIDDFSDLVRDCQEGLSRVKEIVTSLGTFARSEETQTALVDINDCVRLTLKLVSNELKYHCELVVKLAATRSVMGNQSKINQVLMNLLVNAGQAIEGKGQIIVSTGTDFHDLLGECTWFRVEDNGIGIAPENLERIFEPFYSSKDVSCGTGLGLSTAYSIIQKMNGRLEVSSELHKGAAFTAFIPVSHS